VQDDVVTAPIVAESSTASALTQEQLLERETAVKRAESELKKRRVSLDGRESEVDEAVKARESEMILAHLEEHFQCPLCYEIIACPYTLTPAECGHTFCAVCTVKWFFSRLHRGCGTWHESVDCPLCRALLIITPDTTPRSTITIPFAPNRLAEGTLRGLLSRLMENTSKKGTNKTGPGGCTGDAVSCKAEGGVVKLEDLASAQLVTTGAEAWADGGALRKDWLDRERLGRSEMDDIISRWKELTPEEFITIKDRLGV